MTETEPSRGASNPSIVATPYSDLGEDLADSPSRSRLPLTAAVPVSPYPPGLDTQRVELEAQMRIPNLKSPVSAVRSITPATEGLRPIKSVEFAKDVVINPVISPKPAGAENRGQRGFLAIGDLIFLTVVETNEDRQSSRFVVIGDGVAHSEVECAPKKLFKMRSDMARYGQALYRVEPARQYGLLTRMNRSDQSVMRVVTHNQAMVDKLKLQAKEDAAGNDDEFESLSGNLVTYGERIQLRHMHSDTFLTLTEDIAREQGCLKLGLDKGGNEGSWVELQPENKFRQEGERVQYSDLFLVTIELDKSSYYVHMAPSTVYLPSGARELNGSSKSTLWKAKKYIGRMEIKKNPDLVATGDSFRIMLKQSQSYLTVADLGVKRFAQIKHKVVEKFEDARGGQMLCKLDKGNLEEKPSETKSTLYLDDEKSSGNVWELERENVFEGGVALDSEFFKIKNIATGFYLSIENRTQIRAVSDGSKESTKFRFLPEVPLVQLHFKTHLKIQNVSTGLFISAQDYSSSGQKASGAFLQVTDSPKDALRTTFFLEDEVEMNTLHVHQVSVIIQKVAAFYKFLWYWGLMQLSDNEFIQDYKIAKEKELDLEQEAESMKSVLENIVEKVLRPGSVGYKVRQETIMKTRLLELLLKLAELVAEKTQFPSAFPRTPLRGRMGADPEPFDIFKLRMKLWAKCPQLVAFRYLKPLATALYRTLYRCIEDNGNCCESLSLYVRFLSDQLTRYKEEVGQILRAVLKQPVNIFEKLPKEQFTGLMDQLQPISMLENNLKEQTLILRILASLCLRQKQGAANYQYLIREKLFQSPPTRNLCVFWNYNAKQCIELVYRGISPERLMELSPQLQEIALEVTEAGQKHYLFPIPALADYPLLAKYVCAVLELLANLCLSRNNASLNVLTGELGASFDIVFQCMQDARVPAKLRLQFVKLCRVLYIDRHPSIPLEETHDFCFL